MGLRNTYIEMIKYGVTGVFGTVLYFVVLVLLVELLHVSPTVAAFLATLCTISSCFFINSFWTFKTNDASLRRFVKYCVVSVFGLFLATSITYVGVNLVKVWYVYTQSVVVLVVPLSNYLLNRMWVFSPSAADES